jgi:hypothetical protein
LLIPRPGSTDPITMMVVRERWLALVPMFAALRESRWPESGATLAARGVRCLSCPLSSTAGTAETFSTRLSVKLVVDRAEERAGPEDVGDQALMRGLVTAFPFVRPGLSQPGVGRRSCDRPRRQLGSSPCRGPALATARLCLAGCPVRGLKRRGYGPVSLHDSSGR